VRGKIIQTVQRPVETEQKQEDARAIIRNHNITVPTVQERTQKRPIVMTENVQVCFSTTNTIVIEML